MGKVSYYKRGISAFISSEKGQRYFNFAYSIGAAIVIWGALFKILHLPGGTALLSIGMGTEVLMFILTAFDRPPKEYKWEDVFPALADKEEELEEAEKPKTTDAENAETQADVNNAGGNVSGIGGGTVIINGSGVIGGGTGTYSTSPAGGQPQGTPVVGGQPQAVAAPQPMPIVPPTDAPAATQMYIDQITSIVTEMQRLQETTSTLNKVSETLLQSYQAITQNSAEINESATGYVEQMQSLNHNISGLNTIYEIQLKSVASQLDAIDRVNRGLKDIRDMFEKSASQSICYCEETEKMARYMQQLNSVYEKMIHAMTINMYRPAMMQPDDIPVPASATTPSDTPTATSSTPA